MNNLELISVLMGFFPWVYLKLVILVLICLYIVFAAVIVRQEHLMSRVVEIPYSPILRVIALGHFIAAIIAFFLALILI